MIMTKPLHNVFFTIVLFLIILTPIVLPGHADASQSEYEETMRNTIDRMYRELDRRIDGLDPIPPDFINELNTLEKYAEEYIKLFQTEIPVKNRLHELRAHHADRRKLRLDTINSTIKDVTELHSRYAELAKKLQSKRDKIIILSGGKLIFDYVLLPLDRWNFIAERIVDFHDRTGPVKFVPEGGLGATTATRRLGDISKELEEAHELLRKYLYKSPKDRNDFFRLVRLAEVQAKKCWDMAYKIQYVLRKDRNNTLTIAENRIKQYLDKIIQDVDRILATSTTVAKCVIKPGHVTLDNSKPHQQIKIFNLYTSGIEIPVKPEDVSYEIDDKTIVEVDQQGMVTGLKTGIAEVTVKVKKGGLPCRVTVEADFQTVTGKKVSVPDVMGKDRKAAAKDIKKAGLKESIKTAPKMNKAYPPETVILQSPMANSLVDPGSSVSITINPPSLAPPAELLAIILEGDPQPPYLAEEQYSLAAVAAKLNPKNKYTFTWYIDGRKIGQGQSVKHAFPDAGTYTIKVAMTSTESSEYSELEDKITIVTSNLDFSISPTPDKGKTYKEGDTITFTENCKNIKNITEYRWYVNEKYVGSGKKVTHTFNDQGTFKVKMGLRMGSNYDERHCTKSITVGSSIGVLGTWRNRFKARGGLENLSVCSEYWVGGINDWSPKCAEVSKIGPVDGYALCTGEQSDGYNTGFLVYSRKGNEKLNFQVYRFNFNKRKGAIHYSGEIPKAINPDTGSITISCRANVATVRWTNEDGSVCSTKIWKFKYSTVLAHYGIEQPTCSKPSIEPTKLKRCKTFAKRAVEQFNENLNRKCNLQGPEWHENEAGHKQWCLNVSKKEADDLTKHRDNALKNCGKTWCDSYAKRAVEQNEENIRNQCGFSGRRWQSIYNNHYNWCLSVSKRSSDSGTRKRDNDLQNCIRGREGPCKRYAETAVKQNNENIRKDCGFCGQRWQSSFDNHFKWCLEQPQNARALETKAREKLLNKCIDVSSAGKRIFYEPCYNGYRLDNCLNFGTNCEKPAAEKFCEEKGFTKATSWEREKARPTYIVGDRSLCEGDFCVGFKYITCSGYKYPDNINPVCTIKRPKSGIIIQPGMYVRFSADAFDPDYKGYRVDHLNYAWVFEGGRPDKWETWHGSATAQWVTPGTYTATLTVTDGKGGTCTDTVVITVQGKDGTVGCNQYADKSIRQNEENLRKKCGFSGDLWHSSKSGHTNWCLSGNQSRAAQVIASREKALNVCKGSSTITDLVCDITAPSGIAFTNSGGTLDFAGSAQSPAGGSLSYNWKFDEYGATPGTSSKHNPGKVTFKWGGSYKVTLTVTDTKGKTCQATRHVLVYDSNDPREFCEGYASISIEQNEENKRNNCGYSGEHWHDDEFKHQKWCKSVSLDQARSGLRDRDEKLRKCTGKPDIPGDPGKPDIPGDPGSVSQDPEAGRLPPVADSYVYAYAYRNWNKANWGKYGSLGAGWNPTGGEKRTYLKFDLSGIDPKNVGKAIMKLFHYHTGGNNSLSVGIHAVTGTWQEGGGTYHSGKVEKTAAPGEISWVAQPSFSPYQSANFKPGPGTNKYIEVDITQLVKQWLSGVPNNGLVLKATGNLSGRTPASVYCFYSREHKDKSKRPVLILSTSSISDTPTGSKHPLGDITKIMDYPESAENIRGVPCGTDHAFVYSLFQCILERDPEKKELYEQIRDLQSGMSRKDIVIRFFKSREYLNNNKSGRESYKDAFQAVLGRNPSSGEISSFPRTWPFMMAAGLFDTEEYRNLCPGIDDINKPGQEKEYNPLKDTGMGISDKIQSKDKVDALIKQYHDQQYHDTKKDDDKKEDAVYDQSSDYTDGVIGDKAPPVEDKKITDEPHTGVINTPAGECSDNKQ